MTFSKQHSEYMCISDAYGGEIHNKLQDAFSKVLMLAAF